MIVSQHLANEDDVIAAVVAEGGAALEARGALLEQRRLADAVVELEAGKFVLTLAGEAARQVFLVDRQYVHVPVLGAGKGRQAACILGQAPQHHGRIERDRIEAVGGDADHFAIRSAGGDDGDASRESAKCSAEGVGIETLLRRHVVSRKAGKRMEMSMESGQNRVIVPTD